MVVLAVVVLSVPVFATQQIYYLVVNAHEHTTHSDGYHTMGEVAEANKKHGAQATIISDHAEMINKEYALFDTYPKVFLSGFEQFMMPHRDPGVHSWIEDMKKSYSLPLTPGMECGLGAERRSHLLFWDDDPQTFWKVVAFTEGGESDPDTAATNLANLAASCGGVLVRAHPFNNSYPFTVNVPYVEGVTYGVEFFNGTWAQQWSCLRLMVEMQAHTNRPIIATGGADWHGDPYEVVRRLLKIYNPVTAPFLEPYLYGDFNPQLLRRTIIGAAGENRMLLIEGLRAGRCYAAFDPSMDRPSRITFASAMPGEKFQISAQNYRFRLGVSGLFDNDKVWVGVMGKDGRGRIAPSTDPSSGVTHSGGDVEIDLTRFCSKETNCGWWLFVMTPRVVTSAIEILPFEREQIVQTPPATTTPPVTPPSTLPATPPTTQPTPPTTQPPQPSVPTPTTPSGDVLPGCDRVWYDGSQKDFIWFGGSSGLERMHSSIELWFGTTADENNLLYLVRHDGHERTGTLKYRLDPSFPYPCYREFLGDLNPPVRVGYREYDRVGVIIHYRNPHVWGVGEPEIRARITGPPSYFINFRDWRKLR